jgi:antitoxin HigA-1
MSKSSTTTKSPKMRVGKLAPTSPGEVLEEEFLIPLGVSQYRLAKDIGVPPRRINEIVHGKRSLTADTAIRLADYFGTSERFWLNLQTQFDLEVAKDGRRHRRGRAVARRAIYHAPRVFSEGSRFFVQMPNGRIEVLKPTPKHFEVLTAYWEAQGKLEGFVTFVLDRLPDADRRRLRRLAERANRG